MDLNDLKYDFGVFRHAESIYDIFKAIGSSFNLHPVENSNFWCRSTSNSKSLSTYADTNHVVPRFGNFEPWKIVWHTHFCYKNVVPQLYKEQHICSSDPVDIPNPTPRLHIALSLWYFLPTLLTQMHAMAPAKVHAWINLQSEWSHAVFTIDRPTRLLIGYRQHYQIMEQMTLQKGSEWRYPAWRYNKTKLVSFCSELSEMYETWYATSEKVC